MAERWSICDIDISIEELVDSKGEEQDYGDIHDRAHQLSNLFIILQEMRRLFSVKVADLEQDYRFYEPWCDQDKLVEVFIRYYKGISDKDCEL